MKHERVPAVLALADGSVYEGRSIGAGGEGVGEVVFNTSMTGYQEVLTDPSYRGQIVTMTAPQVGNTGINPEDVESSRLHLAGFIVRELSPMVSSWRARGDLGAYLKSANVVGIDGVDTRAITTRLRETGSLMGILSTVELDGRRLSERARSLPGLIGKDLVQEVTCRESCRWVEPVWGQPPVARDAPKGAHVVAVDFGIKQNILRMLVSSGFKVTVVPATTSAEDILALRPDGVFLSNGPGDPEGVPYAAVSVKSLLGKKPIFGICLGHQILGLALGGRTYKLKFGHHGVNHPVKRLDDGRVEITSQNHNFAVDADSLSGGTPFGPVEMTHVSLNDGSLEGMRCREIPVFSVQYHPEASPGPHDAAVLFEAFGELMRRP